MKKCSVFMLITILLLTYSVNLFAGETNYASLENFPLNDCSELRNATSIIPESAAGHLYVGLVMGTSAPIGIYVSYWPIDYLKIHLTLALTKLGIYVDTPLNTGGVYIGALSQGYVSNVLDVGISIDSTDLSVSLFGGVRVGGVLSLYDAYGVALPYIKALSEAYGIEIEIDDAIVQDYLSIEGLDSEAEEEFLNKIGKTMDLLNN